MVQMWVVVVMAGVWRDGGCVDSGDNSIRMKEYAKGQSIYTRHHLSSLSVT